VVCKEGERVNIRFKQGDAKIQMLVRGIQNKRMQPFHTTIEPGVDRKGQTPTSEKNLGLSFKER
jgi:hypothetical protein